MKIKGNTVGFPNPQPDWGQTDTTQADYIKNKPNIYVDDEGYTVIEGQRKVTGFVITKFGNKITINGATEGFGTPISQEIILDENGYPSEIKSDDVSTSVVWGGFDA